MWGSVMQPKTLCRLSEGAGISQKTSYGILPVLTRKHIVNFAGLDHRFGPERVRKICVYHHRPRRVFERLIYPFRKSVRLVRIRWEMCDTRLIEELAHNVFVFSAFVGLEDNRYFVTFIDDFSRYTWVYFTNRKDAKSIREVFEPWKADAENKSGNEVSFALDGWDRHPRHIRVDTPKSAFCIVLVSSIWGFRLLSLNTSFAGANLSQFWDDSVSRQL
jgi:hypothetical protein